MTHGPRRARSSLDCRVLSLARWQGPADTSAAPVHLTDPFMSAAHIQRDALASKPMCINVSKEICFISSPGNGLFLTASPRTTPNAGQWHEKAKYRVGWWEESNEAPSALDVPRTSQWLLIFHRTFPPTHPMRCAAAGANGARRRATIECALALFGSAAPLARFERLRTPHR